MMMKGTMKWLSTTGLLALAAGCGFPQPAVETKPPGEDQLQARLAELKQKDVIQTLFAYEEGAKFYPVWPEQGASVPVREAHHGERVEVLEYADGPVKMWCAVRTEKQEYFRTNCTQFTTAPYDPAGAASAWESYLTQAKAQGEVLTELPNYQEVVRNWDAYEGKLAVLEEPFEASNRTFAVRGINTSTVHLDNRKAKRGMSALAWTRNKGEAGFYRVAIPFSEMNAERDWYDGKTLRLVVEFVEVYDGQRNEDKMPLLLTVAAFDGARFYHYQPERCDDLLAHAARQYLAVEEDFWSCIDRASTDDSVQTSTCNPHTRPEHKWYDQSREAYLGCINSFAWDEASAKRFEKTGRRFLDVHRDATQAWAQLYTLQPGTLKWEEAIEAARANREAHRQVMEEFSAR